MAVDYVKQTIKAGLPPFENIYSEIISLESTELCGYRTELKINSVDLGTLFPKQYRLVANRNAQCVRLAKKSFALLVNDIEALVNAGKLPPFLSLYVPAKMLLRGELQKLFASAQKNGFTYFKNICLEFSSELLLEDTSEVVSRLNSLRTDFGCRFMLSEFGDDFCPTMRISGLPIDIAVLDETVCSNSQMAKLAVKSVINMLKNMGIAVCVEATDSAPETVAAAAVGCDLAISLSGKTSSEVLANV